MRRLFCTALVALATAASCALYAPDTTIARVTLVDAAPEGGDADAPIRCPQTPGGPFMVAFADFCIDSTEVTKAQYAAWLDTKPLAVPSTQTKECSFNVSFAPEVRGPERNCTADLVDAKNNPNDPVVCVDWCDAQAYCSAHVKRLCGRIGGGSQSIDAPASLVDPKLDQWTAACVGEPPSKYPYGDGYVASTCNGREYGRGKALPVATDTTCHGKGAPPYAAIYDLSGNVAEWTDACQIGPGTSSGQSCQTRGGYFDSLGPSELACDYLGIAQPRSWFDDHIGFRCCAP